MRLSSSLVAVKKITSKAPRSNFSEHELIEAAKLVLEAGGIITPLLLRRTSMDSYEVIEGHFEYYAVATARDIDPRKIETVEAFVAEDENEEVIRKQIHLLKANQAIGTESKNVINDDSAIAKARSSLDSRMSEFFATWSREKEELRGELDKLRAQLPERIELLEAFNSLDLETLSSMLEFAGIKGEKLNKILEQIRIKRKEKKKFQSLREMTDKKNENKIDGLGDSTLLNLVDKWSQFYLLISKLKRKNLE